MEERGARVTYLPCDGTGSIDPATESLEIVEITGEVVGATEYFLPWNLGVVHKPITRVIVEGDRRTIATYNDATHTEAGTTVESLYSDL